MKVKIFPAEQRVFIKPIENPEKKTPGGLFIPQTAETDKAEMGLVIATGFGSADNPMNYLVGDKVLYSQYSGLEIRLDLGEIGNGIFKVMNQLDIMAKIKEE